MLDRSNIQFKKGNRKPDLNPRNQRKNRSRQPCNVVAVVVVFAKTKQKQKMIVQVTRKKI